ncbi:MAG: hypothetical protein NTY38_16035, partial [Acidobacteria bacterium]|nr:hypothetical protein [Acidobacteriota bacterium]
SPAWLPVRRAVQAESNELLALQSSLRADAPMDLTLGPAQVATPIPVRAYLESERQVTELIRKLWQKYYQALTGVLDQPGAAGAAAPPTERLAAPSRAHAGAPEPPRAESPAVGVWKYVVGSQQFNGVAEPKQVLLELWMAGETLAGRYRAELTAFDGTRNVDLRLHGTAPAGRGPRTLEFESKDPLAKGRIILEGPGAEGTELMLIRSVTADSPIPRGRELLRRR